MTGVSLCDIQHVSYDAYIMWTLCAFFADRFCRQGWKKHPIVLFVPPVLSVTSDQLQGVCCLLYVHVHVHVHVSCGPTTSVFAFAQPTPLWLVLSLLPLFFFFSLAHVLS